MVAEEPSLKITRIIKKVDKIYYKERTIRLERNRKKIGQQLVVLPALAEINRVN
jgi:hypothetical protein